MTGLDRQHSAHPLAAPLQGLDVIYFGNDLQRSARELVHLPSEGDLPSGNQQVLPNPFEVL